jgi:3-oxoacyl-[acyl-carrier protein] reductase
LVTGSGRHIGRAIVLQSAGRGANVIINARSNRVEAQPVHEFSGRTARATSEGAT